DPARAAFLKREGITVSYEPPGVEAIPEVFKDPDRYWIGFSARTRVLLVNTELVALGEEPLSIFDLVQEQWKGKVAIANPLFGTTSFHLAALVQVLGEDRVFEWLDALKANGVHVVSSNGEVKRQVASGQVAVGLTDSDDAVEAITDGQPVRVVLLDQSTSSGTPLGNLILPNTVSLIQGGPNPAVAKNVLDFLVSVPVQIMLAESCAQAPLTPAVPVPDSVVVLDGIVSMEVDYAACATILEGIMPRFKEWLEQK
ncbi:MAG: extracellular solute-binding protein, partial [Candidatus Hydrogenedentes bacterium]|nr:extracellular solute-binding protein [Candidatus Hydrogenedentota bacterium]